MLKDVRFCLDAVAAAGTRFPLAEAAAEVLERTVAAGHGTDDFAALITALEADAGLSL